MSNESVSTFFNAWEVYDQVLDHDYMYHDEVHRDLKAFLVGHFSQRPFSVLDLGCGSARHMAATLSEFHPSRIVGYDISTVALEYAEEALATTGADVRVCEGDLLEALRIEEKPSDLIFAGYALHHLKNREKQRFSQLASRLLTSSGVLVILDMVREAEENREGFLSDYCQWVADDWGELSEVAVAGIREHVMSSDFPETYGELVSMADSAGLGQAQRISRYGCHQLLVFQSPILESGT